LQTDFDFLGNIIKCETESSIAPGGPVLMKFGFQVQFDRLKTVTQKVKSRK